MQVAEIKPGRSAGYKQSEITKKRLKTTLAKKKVRVDQGIENGILEEDGWKPICSYKSKDGSRCMSFVGEVGGVCNFHQNQQEEDEDSQRCESILEQQVRSEIIMQISKWAEQVHPRLAMEFILEGLKRLMNTSKRSD